MTIDNDFVHSFNVSSTLEQVTEPLESWELVGIGVSMITMLLGTPLMASQWKRFGRTSPRLLKYSLLCMYATSVVSIPFASLSMAQTTTPSHVVYYFTQFIYCWFLASSYVVLFAKQESLFNMGMETIMSETLLKRRRTLVKLFKMQFMNYILASFAMLFLPTIYTIVLAETETTQGVRVVFMHPDWLRVLLALGDSSISLNCLMLFILPLMAFQQGGKVVQSSTNMKKRFYQAAWLNLKWSAIGNLSTFAFLTLGGFLQPRFNTAWFIVGSFDTLLKTFSIGKMFPENSSPSAPNTIRARATPTAVSNISALSLSMLGNSKRRNTYNLFDSSAAESIES